ncbi:MULTISPECIES: MerR family transcriptional regulator [Chitinophagaceae]
MDNQLSLFGFEEPIVPKPSKASGKTKEAENDDSVTEQKSDDLSASPEGAQEEPVTIVAAEKAEGQLDIEETLNEIIVPNREAVSTIIPDQQVAFHDSIESVSPTDEDLETNSNGSLLETSVTTSLDEVVVPNQEIIVSEVLDNRSILEESVVNQVSVSEQEDAPIQKSIPDERAELGEVEGSNESTDKDIVDKTNIPHAEAEIIDQNVFSDSKEMAVAIEPISEIVEDALSENAEQEQNNDHLVEQENTVIPEITETEKDIEAGEKTFSKQLATSFGKKGRKSFKEIDAEVDLIQVPSDEILFSKQYYPISQVAKWFRVNNSLLRFWENEFDILKPRKNRKGDRLFRPEDIKNLQVIYYLLRQKKYTIAGARKYIKNNRKTVDANMKIVQTLNDFKKFLLELKTHSER